MIDAAAGRWCPRRRAMLPGGRLAGKRNFVKRRSFSRLARSVQLALRESPIRLWPQLFGLLAAIAVLAWLGPFNTWGWLSLPDRIAFWTLATGVNWLFGLVVGIASGLALERRGRLAWAAVVAGGSAVAAVPGTAVVWLLVAAYVGYRMTGLAEIALLYSQVITIHLVLNALVTWLIVRQPRKAESENGGRGGLAPTRGSRPPARPSSNDSRPSRSQPPAPSHAGPLRGGAHRRGKRSPPASVP